MMHRKPSLGRGLADLLGSRATAPVAMPPVQVGEELTKLPLDLLQRGRYQPRMDMRPETLSELADSIKAHGVVQPIVVRPLEPPVNGESQRYEIIAGERRWRAAQMAGLSEIPAVIRHIPDEAAIAVALIENIQRENLNPLEEARALERLVSEFGLTHQEAAQAVGRSRAGVTNLLRLLELTAEVCELLEKRTLEMGHARPLLAPPEPRPHSEVPPPPRVCRSARRRRWCAACRRRTPRPRTRMAASAIRMWRVSSRSWRRSSARASRSNRAGAVVASS